jgi:hypothetical protein
LKAIEIGFIVREAKRLMGLKVHQDGAKLANFLEFISFAGNLSIEATFLTSDLTHHQHFLWVL